MSTNYYDQLIKKIEDFIENKQNDEALALINEELKLPYVPKIYEDKLYEYKNKLDCDLNTVKKQILFSRDELITIMNEFKKHDINFLIDIASAFEHYNWTGYEQEIENIFKSDIDNKIKAIIYNSLVIQNHNHNFNINNKIINPIKNKTIFETQFALKNFLELTQMNLKDPSLIEISKKIFFIYLMNIFPDSLFFEHENITEELISIAQVMVGEKNIDNLNEKTLKIYKHINEKE